VWLHNCLACSTVTLQNISFVSGVTAIQSVPSTATCVKSVATQLAGIASRWIRSGRSADTAMADSGRWLEPKSVDIKSIQAVLKTILFLVFVCKIHVSGIEIIIWRRDCVN
jgi:hypothetical protein